MRTCFLDSSKFFVRTYKRQAASDNFFVRISLLAYLDTNGLLAVSNFIKLINNINYQNWSSLIIRYKHTSTQRKDTEVE